MSAGTPVHEPLDAVGVFAPWAAPDERALRLRIHRARDAAQARAIRSKHEGAQAVYWLAAQFAGRWVFQRASADQLQEVIKGVTWQFLFAGLLERMETSE